MQRHGTRLLFFCFALLLSNSARAQSPGINGKRSPPVDAANRSIVLHKTRQFPGDLAVGGDLASLPPGTTRFLSRDDLLALPQITFTVPSDSNFTGSPEIRGVRLDDPASRIAATPDSDMVIAICNDKYRANYPRAYLAAHQPAWFVFPSENRDLSQGLDLFQHPGSSLHAFPAYASVRLPSPSQAGVPSSSMEMA